MSQAKLEAAFNALSTNLSHNNYTEQEHTLFNRAIGILFEHPLHHEPTLIKVIQLLVEQDVDMPVVISAIIAPMLWDSTISTDVVRNVFGKTITQLVTSLDCTEINRLCSWTNQSDNTDNSCCLSEKISNRTLLSIALLLIDLEQMAAGNKDINLMKAREALHIFAPLASLFNQREIRRRLEDTAFQLLEPDIYVKFKRELEPIPALDIEILQILKDGLQILLERSAIKGEIQGRVKSLYSLHAKVERSGRSVKSIMDRIGLRIIVNSITECYKVIGIIHSHFRSIPCCFDDYISSPKENGYQSLHTCIFPVRNISYKPVELQIRTKLMNNEAEFGVAAHFKYKSTVDTVSANNHSSNPMSDESEAENSQKPDKDEFLWLLKQQVHTDNMVIFGPAGKIMHCPVGITTGQYLEKAMIKVCPQTLILVNGEPSSMSTTLHDTDSVEVVRSDRAVRQLKMILNNDWEPHKTTESIITTVSSLW